VPLSIQERDTDEAQGRRGALFPLWLVQSAKAEPMIIWGRLCYREPFHSGRASRAGSAGLGKREGPE
jgi:hypothetical protein